MASDWKIRKGGTDGGQTGQLLDGCEIRINEEGDGYEFIAVLARTHGNELPAVPFEFPQFAYRGLIWKIAVERFEADDQEARGPWSNNFRDGKPSAPEDESGTYTAQSGPGAPEGMEDAASASA